MNFGEGDSWMSLEDLKKGKESADALRVDLIILAIAAVIVVVSLIYVHYNP